MPLTDVRVIPSQRNRIRAFAQANPGLRATVGECELKSRPLPDRARP